MLTGMLHLHNIMRWVVLLTGLYAIIKTASGLGGTKSFTRGDKKSALFFMISCDIQLILGLILFFISPLTLEYISANGMGAAMKDKAVRYFLVEHGLMMIIAIILVHIGYAMIKRPISDGSKFKRVFWFYLIAMVIMLASIPWPNKEFVGRALFPGMG